MFKKRFILEHHSLNLSYPDIEPIKNVIPDWYKKTERISDGTKIIKKLPVNLTFKACSSFGDSFITGYYIPLPVDIAVQQTPEGPSVSWTDDENVFVELRDASTNKKLPTPTGHSSLQFAWITKHVFKVPRGYSALVTHPLNRTDLPFFTLTGIVDGEISLHNGNIPVYFSSTFEGVIPSGTPIAQIILFKNKKWTSKKNKKILQDAAINAEKSKNTTGWYKKNHWKKKFYE